MAGTLGELRRTKRRARFVGRDRELAVFRDALARDEPSVLYVYGPGGIGKTSLLDAFADLAADHGVPAQRVDCRDLEPSPRAFLAAVGDRGQRGVLLLDTYERLEALDRWVRDAFLTHLPAGQLVVVAGRTPPAAAWQDEWRDVVRLLPLRNLAPDEARAYLKDRGVKHRETIVERSYGHPLGLSLLADIAERDGDVDVRPLRPDLVASLIERFVNVTPSSEHRAALEVCGLARATTEALLRDAVGTTDAHELFAWLRGLSFVESGPDGLFPHDLARDALVADLHWRDPETYERIFRGIRGHVLGELRNTHGRAQQKALFDAKFMHRFQSVSRWATDWTTFGQHYPEPAQPADQAAVLDLIRGWEGEESAALARRWWERQPEAFHVVRTPEGDVRGVLALLDLSRADAGDVAADPAARAAWRHAAGGTVTLGRFTVDREAHQAPSPTVNIAPVLTIQHWMTTPNLSRGFITKADAEQWEEFFAFFEILRVPGADVELGGRRYGLFVRDFDAIPVNDWLELMLERDLTGDAAPRPSPAPVELALSAPDFEAAVRQALRDLHRPALLADSPLTHSASATDTTVRELLCAAIERLATDPRDAKLHRVLDRTYLRPAASQEKAAEVLGLPLSTYKRHHKRAVERLVADLWHLELGQS